MLDEILYSKLIYIDNDIIIVEKENKRYILTINCDNGDCCGYNVVETTLLFDEKDTKNNPVIMRIEEDENLSEYDENKITFFGIDKQLAILNSESGSGSGWMYGANVTIICHDLNIDETITSW